MRLLILGGTVFLGRHLVDEARARGHDVTLFNRGTHADVHADVEQLRGDRRGDLAALRGRDWDAAIDTNAYVPWEVTAIAETLRDRVPHLALVSSISVHADFSRADYDESSPVHVWTEDMLARARAHRDDRAVIVELYGPLKAACEQAIEEAVPGRALVVRPGLIVGPYDPTDRFTYWARRTSQDGELLAPGRPQRPVQVIDARDLAAWMVTLAERRVTGVYQATGPERPLAMAEVVEAGCAVSGSNANVVWVPDAYLVEAGVGPWMEMPLWIPESDPQVRALCQADVSRARRAGLTYRPLADTLRDTQAWDAARGRPPLNAGLAPGREAELLSRWHAHSAAR